MRRGQHALPAAASVHCWSQGPHRLQPTQGFKIALLSSCLAGQLAFGAFPLFPRGTLGTRDRCSVIARAEPSAGEGLWSARPEDREMASAEMQLHFERNGFCHVPSFLNVPEASSLAQELAQVQSLEICEMAALQHELRQHVAPSLARSCRTTQDCKQMLQKYEKSGKVKFLQYFNLHRHSALLRRAALSPRLALWAARLLGVSQVRLYQDALFMKYPRHGPTRWHSDLALAPFDTNAFVTVWLALTPVPAKGGAGLRFAQGSHRDYTLQYHSDLADSYTQDDLSSRYLIAEGTDLAMNFFLSNRGDLNQRMGALAKLSKHSAQSDRAVETLFNALDGAMRRHEHALVWSAWILISRAWVVDAPNRNEWLFLSFVAGHLCDGTVLLVNLRSCMMSIVIRAFDRGCSEPLVWALWSFCLQPLQGFARLHDGAWTLALRKLAGVSPRGAERVFCEAIACCSRATQWVLALDIFSKISASGALPNIFIFSAAISACEKGSQWQLALLCLFSDMAFARVVPNIFSFSAAISACEKSGRSEEALALLSEAQSAEVVPDVVCFSAAISAAEKCGQWQVALQLLSNMLQARTASNVIAVSAAISACEKGGQWRMALQLLSGMSTLELQANEVSFSAGISACEKAGRWQLALALLSRMAVADLTPNKISFSAAVSACETAGEWQQALHLLSKMFSSATLPDRICMNAGISACEKGSRWEIALQLLWSMATESLLPNTISFSAAISACDKSGEWVSALLLLTQMSSKQVRPNEVSFSAGISACEQGDQWQMALEILSEMARGLVRGFGRRAGHP
ncbi:unnamed protein product [Symbiodinium sp. CCMP2592]|nr:unnamed protein product [Symbiodinium sp. CCMP2592]